MASRALPQIYVLVSSVLIARFLTVGDMGRQSYISFVQLSLILVCSFGFSGALDPLRRRAARAGPARRRCAVSSGGRRRSRSAARSSPSSSWAASDCSGTASKRPGCGRPSVPRSRRSRTSRTACSACCAGGGRARSSRSSIGLAFTVGIAVELALGGGVAGVFAVGAVLSIVATVWTTWIAQKYLHSVAPGRGTGARPVPPDDRLRADDLGRIPAHARRAAAFRVLLPGALLVGQRDRVLLGSVRGRRGSRIRGRVARRAWSRPPSPRCTARATRVASARVSPGPCASPCWLRFRSARSASCSVRP